jgi:hypothetical protein
MADRIPVHLGGELSVGGDPGRERRCVRGLTVRGAGGLRRRLNDCPWSMQVSSNYQLAPGWCHLLSRRLKDWGRATDRLPRR